MQDEHRNLALSQPAKVEILTEAARLRLTAPVAGSPLEDGILDRRDLHKLPLGPARGRSVRPEVWIGR